MQQATTKQRRIRDNHRNRITGYCRNISNTSRLSAEFWALKDGLKLAFDLDLTPIEIETDALTLVNLLMKPCNEQHHLSNLNLDCKFLLYRLRSPIVKHISLGKQIKV
ncbi:hypothetical protein ACSBR2_023309 [Camellia fascicularis]